MSTRAVPQRSRPRRLLPAHDAGQTIPGVDTPSAPQRGRHIRALTLGDDTGAAAPLQPWLTAPLAPPPAPDTSAAGKHAATGAGTGATPRIGKSDPRTPNASAHGTGPAPRRCCYDSLAVSRTRTLGCIQCFLRRLAIETNSGLVGEPGQCAPAGRSPFAVNRAAEAADTLEF